MKKDHSKVEIEISQKEFDLCEKVANILIMFCEATKLLSKEDCSISNSIPIVTTIITQLSSKSDSILYDLWFFPILSFKQTRGGSYHRSYKLDKVRVSLSPNYELLY